MLSRQPPPARTKYYLYNSPIVLSGQAAATSTDLLGDASDASVSSAYRGLRRLGVRNWNHSGLCRFGAIARSSDSGTNST